MTDRRARARAILMMALGAWLLFAGISYVIAGALQAESGQAELLHR